MAPSVSPPLPIHSGIFTNSLLRLIILISLLQFILKFMFQVCLDHRVIYGLDTSFFFEFPDFSSIFLVHNPREILREILADQC